MNILLCTWGSICENGIISAAKRLGHNLHVFKPQFSSPDLDKNYVLSLSEYIQKNPDTDCVLSVNFVPIVAKVCKIHRLPYLSWTVDCPSLPLYSDAISYPTNYIFLFDKIQADKFADINPGHVFHLSLASDIDYYDKITVSQKDHSEYDCDISFIGSLYTEKCQYDKIAHKLPDYIRGYAEALVNAQQNVYGYNFIEDSISEDWANEFKKYADWTLLPGYREDLKSIISDNYLGYKCTAEDRVNTAYNLSQYFDFHLYTLSDTSAFPGINNKGGADTGRMMPRIFKCSKINLNTTLRSIKVGIPQRIFDILGCGGFVISNYQAEIPEHFTPGEDIVLYESIPDLLSKVDYYLTHEDERLAIAKSGHDKVRRYHTYDVKLAQMFEMAGL